MKARRYRFVYEGGHVVELTDVCALLASWQANRLVSLLDVRPEWLAGRNLWFAGTTHGLLAAGDPVAFTELPEANPEQEASS